MTHPKTVKLFEPWARAMVAGATVDRPDYGKKAMSSNSRKGSAKRRRRRKKRKKVDA